MAYGSTRNLRLADIVRLKFLSKVRWHPMATAGFVVHMVGRAMPYVYVIAFGENLPPWVYVIVLALFLVSTALFARHLFMRKKTARTLHDAEVIRLDTIDDSALAERLWGIYDATFSKVNERSPCRQSLSRDEFFMELTNESVHKYLLTSLTVGAVGVAFVSNDFKNAPWVSEPYFAKEYPEFYARKRIYYFLGIAIDREYRSNRLSLDLLEYIIDDIPHDAIVAFDHSKNVNPLLHHFTRVVRQARKLRRTRIEEQHYHVVRRV
jgi:hypothetical protein